MGALPAGLAAFGCLLARLAGWNLLPLDVWTALAVLLLIITVRCWLMADRGERAVATGLNGIVITIVCWISLMASWAALSSLGWFIGFVVGLLMVWWAFRNDEPSTVTTA